MEKSEISPNHNKNRPDLIADRGGLSEEEQKLLESFPEGELGD